LRALALDISQIKALTPGTAVHPKGKKKAEEILAAATYILAFEGYSNFTMRRIAEKVGVRLRNVQYYFNTKDSLLQAVIEERLRQDIESAASVIKQDDLSPEERFLAFVDLSLEENTTPFIRGLQFELWALANNNPLAAKCRDHMTTVYSNFIYELIEPLTISQSDATRRKKAVILLAMLQGFPLIEGSDVNIEYDVGDLRELFRKEALRFVTSRET
jgi:AcrR family transcriptional regulator